MAKKKIKKAVSRAEQAGQKQSGAAKAAKNGRSKAAAAMAVNRGSGVSLWKQIAESLEAEIVGGRLSPGTRLPTEAELAERYGVNRHTLRRALAELSRKGLVEAAPRRGTFVSKPRIPYRVNEWTRFSENITRAGREPGMRLLYVKVGHAPDEMAAWLGIAQAAEVIEIEHVRVANGVPICLSTTWLPADRFGRIGSIYERVGSLTKAYARLGIKSYSRARTRITARVATTAECEALELLRGAVIIVADALDVDADGEPISASHARFAADRVELLLEP